MALVEQGGGGLPPPNPPGGGRSPFNAHYEVAINVHPYATRSKKRIRHGFSFAEGVPVTEVFTNYEHDIDYTARGATGQSWFHDGRGDVRRARYMYEASPYPGDWEGAQPWNRVVVYHHGRGEVIGSEEWASSSHPAHSGGDVIRDLDGRGRVSTVITPSEAIPVGVPVPTTPYTQRMTYNNVLNYNAAWTTGPTGEYTWPPPSWGNR